MYPLGEFQNAFFTIFLHCTTINFTQVYLLLATLLNATLIISETYWTNRKNLRIFLYSWLLNPAKWHQRGTLKLRRTTTLTEQWPTETSHFSVKINHCKRTEKACGSFSNAWKRSRKKKRKKNPVDLFCRRQRCTRKVTRIEIVTQFFSYIVFRIIFFNFNLSS